MSVRSSLGAFHSTSSPKLTERRVRDKKTASNSASRLPLHERIERVLLLRRQGEQDDQSLPPRSLDITGSDPRYKSDTYASNYQQLHDSTSDSEAAQEGKNKQNVTRHCHAHA